MNIRMLVILAILFLLQVSSYSFAQVEAPPKPDTEPKTR